MVSGCVDLHFSAIVFVGELDPVLYVSMRLLWRNPTQLIAIGDDTGQSEAPWCRGRYMVKEGQVLVQPIDYHPPLRNVGLLIQHEAFHLVEDNILEANYFKVFVGHK